MSPRRLLLIVIFCYGLIGRVLNQESDTPGQSLSDALDELKSDVGLLQYQMSRISPDNISRLESRVNDAEQRLTNAESNIDYAINEINKIETRTIPDMNKKLTDLSDNMDTMNGELNDMKLSQAQMQSTISSVEKSSAKLENVNKIWKNNFRIVNATFAALRKKVTFQTPRVRVV